MSKRQQRLLLSFLTLLFIYGGSLIRSGATPPAVVPTPSPEVAGIQKSNEASTSAQVTKVVDGDTIDVEIDGQKAKVRYIGVDTPETVDPRKPVQCFGADAKKKNQELVEGKTVYLSKDVSETDRYGRLLRFVYVTNGDTTIFVNEALVKDGYAHVLTVPPDVSKAEYFKSLEEEARTKNLGLWSSCPRS
jgi:endonuclease YncB( thermonuclease family)